MTVPREDIAALVAAHQMVSTVTDACCCGAGDIDTLAPSGTAVTRHRNHLALVIEARLRRAWDEGWDARDIHGPVTGVANPYARS